MSSAYAHSHVQKLIKRTISRESTNLLLARQHEQIKHLRVLAHEGFPKAREDWERSVMQWGASPHLPFPAPTNPCAEKRQERAKAEANGECGTAGPRHSPEGSPAGSDTHATPSVCASALSASVDDEDAMVGGRGGAHPPAQRYRLTDQMTELIWSLVCMINEHCRIENEKRKCAVSVLGEAAGR